MKSVFTFLASPSVFSGLRSPLSPPQSPTTEGTVHGWRRSYGLSNTHGIAPGDSFLTYLTYAFVSGRSLYLSLRQFRALPRASSAFGLKILHQLRNIMYGSSNLTLKKKDEPSAHGGRVGGSASEGFAHDEAFERLAVPQLPARKAARVRV